MDPLELLKNISNTFELVTYAIARCKVNRAQWKRLLDRIEAVQPALVSLRKHEAEKKHKLGASEYSAARESKSLTKQLAKYLDFLTRVENFAISFTGADWFKKGLNHGEDANSKGFQELNSELIERQEDLGFELQVQESVARSQDDEDMKLDSSMIHAQTKEMKELIDEWSQSFRSLTAIEDTWYETQLSRSNAQQLLNKMSAIMKSLDASDFEYFYPQHKSGTVLVKKFFRSLLVGQKTRNKDDSQAAETTAGACTPAATVTSPESASSSSSSSASSSASSVSAVKQLSDTGEAQRMQAEEQREKDDDAAAVSVSSAATSSSTSIPTTVHKNAQMVSLSFVQKFGQKGNGEGEFDGPYGVAVSKNLLYVSDTTNDRVQIFDATTFKFIREFGRGQLTSPKGIVIADGLIYVVDGGHDQVAIFDDSTTQFIRSFGKSGTAPGEFKFPDSIAISNGLIYVTDSGNNRVQVFDTSPANKFVASFGEEGKKDGQFDKPTGIAVSNGLIYVCDLCNRIQVFNESTRTFVRAYKSNTSSALIDAIAISQGFIFMTNSYGCEVLLESTFDFVSRFGKSDRQFSNFRGVAVSNGFIYVANDQINQVQVFEMHTSVLKAMVKAMPTFVHTFGKQGAGEGEFESPYGVAVSKNLIYVSDTEIDRVQIFDATTLKFIGEFGCDQLTSPKGIVIADGLIYVVDVGHQRVAIFDESTTQFIRSFGKSGTAPGEFKFPDSIAISNGLIYVTDSGNNRVQVFDTSASNKFVASFGEKGKEDGQFDEPRGIAVSNGLIYVGDFVNKRVQIFSVTDLKFMRSLTLYFYPRDIAIWEGLILVANSGSYGSIKVFRESSGEQVFHFGQRGEQDGKFLSADAIAISNGMIYVVDRKLHRIQAFRIDVESVALLRDRS